MNVRFYGAKAKSGYTAPNIDLREWEWSADCENDSKNETRIFLDLLFSLPPKHEVVKRLIYNTYVKNCHAGVQMLLNVLKEKYCILSGRKAFKHVVANCVICKRYVSKNLEVIIPPLPEIRVGDAAAIQVTKVDMPGPLFLKETAKAGF
ncbi:integrase catalytic domain-containing protein [Trichonephila clavipes]|nr:integrase catalytic domain-containing protein [Trichonephila clavipes]